MPYKENYELKPNYPYDTSKACADMIAKSYASNKLYKLPIIITRFANIYGCGQLNFTALIPDAIRSCLLNKKFSLSDGEAIRDFIYINDITELYKLLAKNLYLYQKIFRGSF